MSGKTDGKVEASRASEVFLCSAVSGTGTVMARTLFARLYTLTRNQIEQLERQTQGQEATTCDQVAGSALDEKEIKALALLTKQLDNILALEKRLLELDADNMSGEMADDIYTLAEQRRLELAQRLESLKPHPDQKICGLPE